jgi:hypothetical protein
MQQDYNSRSYIKVVKTIVTLESAELMKVFPQPNAPKMAHVLLRAEGNHASSTHCKKIKK